MTNYRALLQTLLLQQHRLTLLALLNHSQLVVYYQNLHLNQSLNQHAHETVEYLLLTLTLNYAQTTLPLTYHQICYCTIYHQIDLRDDGLRVMEIEAEICETGIVGVWLVLVGEGHGELMLHDVEHFILLICLRFLLFSFAIFIDEFEDECLCWFFEYVIEYPEVVHEWVTMLLEGDVME